MSTSEASATASLPGAKAPPVLYLLESDRDKGIGLAFRVRRALAWAGIRVLPETPWKDGRDAWLRNQADLVQRSSVILVVVSAEHDRAELDENFEKLRNAGYLRDRTLLLWHEEASKPEPGRFIEIAEAARFKFGTHPPKGEELEQLARRVHGELRAGEIPSSPLRWALFRIVVLPVWALIFLSIGAASGVLGIGAFFWGDFERIYERVSGQPFHADVHRDLAVGMYQPARDGLSNVPFDENSPLPRVGEDMPIAPDSALPGTTNYLILLHPTAKPIIERRPEKEVTAAIFEFREPGTHTAVLIRCRTPRASQEVDQLAKEIQTLGPAPTLARSVQIKWTGDRYEVIKSTAPSRSKSEGPRPGIEAWAGSLRDILMKTGGAATIAGQTFLVDEASQK